MKDSKKFIGVTDFMKAFRFMNSNELKLFFNNKGQLIFNIVRFGNGRIKSITPKGFIQND